MNYRTCSKCGKVFIGDFDDCGCQSAVQLNGNQEDATKNNEGGCGSCLLSIIIFLIVITIGHIIGSIIGGAVKGLVTTPTVEDLTTKIGDRVPNISWTTISREKIDLNQFKGSWVLLCYWCPCHVPVGDILAIRDVYNALYDKNLKVVVIEDNAITRPPVTLEIFANENNLPFYLVEDNQQSINKMMPKEHERGSRPIYFLIDANGDLHDIRDGYFIYRDEPPTKLPINDFDAQAAASTFPLDLSKSRTTDVLVFLYDAISVKFDDIVITNITSHGATIRWKTDKAVPCELHGNSFWKRLTEPSTNHEYRLDEDDIYPNKACIFTITASSYDNSKLGLPMALYCSSKELLFTTLTAPCISNVKISNITDKSAELYWETDLETNGTAKLSISSNRDYAATDIEKDQSFTTTHSVKVGKLKPYQYYYVDLRSEDVAGRYDTYRLWFRTQPDNYKYGVEIFNIKVSDLTDKSVKINWSTDRAVSSWADIAKATYLADKPTRDHSCIRTQLEPETEYLVQLMAEEGGVSDVFNFKTLKAIGKVDMK